MDLILFFGDFNLWLHSFTGEQVFDGVVAISSFVEK